MSRIIKILVKNALMSLVITLISLGLILISVYGITKTVSATSFKNDIPEVKNLQEYQASPLSVTATPTPAKKTVRTAVSTETPTPTVTSSPVNPNSGSTHVNNVEKKEDEGRRTYERNRIIIEDHDIENVHEDEESKPTERKEVDREH